MIGYILIGILAIGFVWQTWRKRVWKRRFKAADKHGDKMYQAACEALANHGRDIQRQIAVLRAARPDEWPTIIEENEIQ